MTDRSWMIWGVFCVFIAGLSVYGYVSNIITVFQSDFAIVTGELILRVAGIVILPIGVIMGYV